MLVLPECGTNSRPASAQCSSVRTVVVPAATTLRPSRRAAFSSIRGRLGKRVAFRVQMDLLHALDAHRLKCPQPYMQSDIRDAHAARANPVENLRSEMQARRWSSDRSALLRVDRLISLAVRVHIRAMDVRRQRNMSQLLELAEEIRDRLEPQRALAEFTVRDDLRAQRTVAEGQRFSR